VGSENPATDEPSHSRDNESRGIQVLSRAVDVLRVVSQQSEDLSLGKIALQVGLPRSTVQRIVSALVDEKLLIQGPNAAGYRIGPQIHALSDADKPDVPRYLHPVLEQLSDTCSETVDLAVWRNDQMIFIDQVSGNQRLRTVSAVGDSFPMAISANGKAVLALQDNETVKRILVSERKQKVMFYSDAKIQKELKKIRRDGYGLDIDEHTPGISAVGIAFKFNDTFYAVSIPAPSSRFAMHRDQFIRELLDARSAISKLLFGVEFEI